MELRQLHYFLAVAEELHFSRAAERLHIAQQPLSFQIKQLEDELGVQLFYRTTRRVELTPAGNHFLHHARQAIEQLNLGIEAAQRAERGEIGRLALGYVGTTLYNIFPATLRLFRERYPNIEVSLHELNSPFLEQKILKGELDVGLVARFMDDADLAAVPLLYEGASVALPKNHPLAAYPALRLRDLAKTPFVFCSRTDKPLAYDQMIAGCLAAGFSPIIAQEAASDQAIIGLVAAGVGVALISACMEILRPDEVDYRPLIEPDVQVEYRVTWRRDNPSPIVQAFVQTAVEVAELQAVDNARIIG